MDARALKDRATELLAKGKFARAAEAYQQYCEADAKDLQSRLRLGDAWLKAGEKAKAIVAYLWAAEGFAKEGFLPRAIAASKLVLELDPSHGGVQNRLAQLYARKSSTASRVSRTARLVDAAAPVAGSADDEVVVEVSYAVGGPGTAAGYGPPAQVATWGPSVERQPEPEPQPALVGRGQDPNAPPPPEKIDVDATLTWNERELLQKADFDTMTADEWRAAQALLRQMAPLFEPISTRRTARAGGPGRLARVDGRATLQALARHGGEVWQLHWRRPREQPAPLVVLADISGSMSRYSRMLLHFTHALGHADARVESFVFGTRLTRTTHALRQRDPDIAVARVVGEVQDWSGGTRISACLQQFNQRWARRTLSGRATVLLISDGLEHGTPDDPRCKKLRFEMERLHKSCRKLIWLNPLLRFEQFQPRAAGIQAMLPFVDRFLPAHNLQSLRDLAAVLAGRS